MADQKKVVRWHSAMGKLASDVLPKTNIPLQPAHSVLEKAHAFMAPFVKKLSTNPGDASIAITVEYEEKNRAGGFIASLQKQAVSISDRLSADPAYSTDPFRPAPRDVVRHSTDLPCPTCKAVAGIGCGPDATIIVHGNGYTLEDTIKIHESRARLFSLYASLV